MANRTGEGLTEGDVENLEPKANGKKPRSSGDSEILAMQRVWRLLADEKPAAKTRVLRSLLERAVEEERESQQFPQQFTQPETAGPVVQVRHSRW